MARAIPCLLATCLLACVYPSPRSDVSDPAPAKNADATCLPAAPAWSPTVARARADVLKRLIKATEQSDPEMPRYLHRLALLHFAGGHIAGGCKVLEVAVQVGDADHLANSTQLRMDHCFDRSTQRCTTWYEPAPARS